MKGEITLTTVPVESGENGFHFGDHILVYRLLDDAWGKIIFCLKLANSPEPTWILFDLPSTGFPPSEKVALSVAAQTSHTMMTPLVSAEARRNPYGASMVWW